MSSDTAECERCRDGDSNNHWDHRTKATFQTIHDRVKYLVDKPPRSMKDLQGALRELLAKHIDRTIGRQIFKSKNLFDKTNLFPQRDDEVAPNYFRWAFNGNYIGFPKSKLSSWSYGNIKKCFEALENGELYVEDLEKPTNLNESKFQLAKAAEDAFRKHISEHTGNSYVKDLQKCFVGDGSAGLRGWKWDFSSSWQEDFHKFPHQRLLWKWSDRDLKASIELLKNGSLKLVPCESLRSSSSSAPREKTAKKETKATKNPRRRGNTIVPRSDDEDDEEDEPHNDDDDDDDFDFDSGSTVVVDEGSISIDFESYLHTSSQLVKYPARLEKLRLEMSELRTLNENLVKRESELKIKLGESKKKQKLDSCNNQILLEKLGEMEQKLGEKEEEIKKMKMKCDRLAQENKLLSRDCAVLERNNEKITRVASNTINQATTALKCNDILTAEVKQKNKMTAELNQKNRRDKEFTTGMLANSQRSHPPVPKPIDGPTEPPSPPRHQESPRRTLAPILKPITGPTEPRQAGHQESPRKILARPSNIPASSKGNPHLGFEARNRISQPNLSLQSPTRPPRHPLIQKTNNAHVSTSNSHLPSGNNQDTRTIIAKNNTPTAEGSENMDVSQGDTEWLETESPDCGKFRIKLDGGHEGGQTFSSKREWSDDERSHISSKRARN